MISKKPFHTGLPYGISIEPTNICNLHCPECPSGEKMLQRDRGYINMEAFQNIVDQLYKNLIYLNLYFQGEPFLNKNLFDLIKYAKTKKIYTITSTNAQFLSEEICIKIIESGLDCLVISMDGIDQKTYSKYRVGGDIEKVKKAIFYLNDIKKKHKSSTPFILLQFIVFKTNEHQINDIKQFAKTSGVNKLQLKTAQINDYKNDNKFIPLIKKYSRYKILSDGSYELKHKLSNHCFKMWSSCVFTWDGKLVPCCFDKDAKYQMGDISNESIINIWKSKNYYDFRLKILTKRKNIDICCNCNF